MIKTRAELDALIAEKLPNNGLGQISAEDVRALLEDLVDSTFIKTEDTLDQVTDGASKLPVTTAEKSSWNGKLSSATQADTISGSVFFSASKIFGRPETPISNASITIDKTNAVIGARVTFLHTGGLPTFTAATDEAFYQVTNFVDYNDTLTNEISMIFVGNGSFVWSAKPIGGAYVAPITNGWADYNDSTTAGTPLVLNAGVWTTLTNDAAGAFTQETYLPDGVKSLWDTATNKVDLSELSVGDMIHLRCDFSVTPGSPNEKASIKFNLGSGGTAFSLETRLPSMESSGTEYKNIHVMSFYIGSEDIKTSGVQVQIKTSGAATAVNNGIYIEVHKRA